MRAVCVGGLSSPHTKGEVRDKQTFSSSSFSRLFLGMAPGKGRLSACPQKQGLLQRKRP